MMRIVILLLASVVSLHSSVLNNEGRREDGLQNHAWNREDIQERVQNDLLKREDFRQDGIPINLVKKGDNQKRHQRKLFETAEDIHDGIQDNILKRKSFKLIS